MVVAKLSASHISFKAVACTQAGTVCVRHKAEVVCLDGKPLHNLDFKTCGSSHHNASASSLVISCNSDYLPYRVP